MKNAQPTEVRPSAFNALTSSISIVPANSVTAQHTLAVLIALVLGGDL